MTLVVTLTVRRDARARFVEFERAAARILERHGGAIERTVVVDGDGAAEVFREVHIVSFADAAGFAAYRADPALAALAPLRAEAIVATEILSGEEGPDYHAPAP
jgi:hypothetical protein